MAACHRLFFCFRERVGHDCICMTVPHLVLGLQPVHDFHVLHALGLAHKVQPVADRVAVLLLDGGEVGGGAFGLFVGGHGGLSIGAVLAAVRAGLQVFRFLNGDALARRPAGATSQPPRFFCKSQHACQSLVDRFGCRKRFLNFRLQDHYIIWFTGIENV